MNLFSRPSVSIKRIRHDESTSNLQWHATMCTPLDFQETRALQAYANGSKYNKATHHMKIALWIACRNRPFSIIEDPELLDIFADLNSNCETPKRQTVSCNIKEIFAISCQNVGTMLKVSV